jgi:argininosuccinate synthase
LHDPFMRDIEAFLASSQAVVDGSVHVQLAAGRVIVTGVESPHSMLAASDAAYGERAASGSDPRAAAFLGRILAEPARLARVAGERAQPWVVR